MSFLFSVSLVAYLWLIGEDETSGFPLMKESSLDEMNSPLCHLSFKGLHAFIIVYTSNPERGTWTKLLESNRLSVLG